MEPCEGLRRLVSARVLPEVEEAIDELFDRIATLKRVDEAAKSRYEELRELQAALKALLEDLREGLLEPDECERLRSQLQEMSHDDV